MSLRALLLGALSYIVLLTVIAFAVPLSRVTGERVEREVRMQASAEAELVATAASAGATEPVLDALVENAARVTRGRVIVVDADGLLRCDSARPAAADGSDYASRPEVAAALGGRAVQERRQSESLDRPLLVTAEPVTAGDGRNAGAVRVSQDVGAIARAVDRSRLGLLALGLLVLMVGSVVAALLARRLGGPLAALEEAADAVAGGDMTAVAPETGSREQRSVARAFNTMTARLDRTLTAQQQFVSNASHQLRTPLTGVRLRIEEALAESPTSEAAMHLEAATAEVDRLAAMVDDLLVLGRTDERPQAGRPVDLERLAGGAAERMRAAAVRQGRRIDVEVVTPGAVVLADRADLDRVLDALIENALVYGRGAIDVVVRGGRIEICDHGPGLAAGEDDGRLLDRFMRGSAGRRQPGTGLGLAIASTLAARWGGTVGLTSRPGGGAVASLELTGASA